MMLNFQGICSIMFYIILILYLLFLKFIKKKKYTFLLFVLLFGIYLSFVIEYTQFPLFIGEEVQKAMGFDGDVWGQINYIPIIGLKIHDLKTSCLNVLMTIPFGFLIPFIKKVKFKQICTMGIVFTVSIELTQLILGLIVGDTIRVIDINDIIFNQLGVIIGYFLFNGFTKLIFNAVKEEKVNLNSLIQYIIEMKK